MDFWEKFHQEWEELNRREEMRYQSKKGLPAVKSKIVSKFWTGGQWTNRLPSKFWAGGQAAQTDATV